MMDLFFCHVPGDPMRSHMANLCLERWGMEKGIGARVFLTPKDLGCSAAAFQRQRRVIAEEKAQTELYILADDDCLLLQPVAETNLDSRVGMCSLMPSNCNIVPWEKAGQMAGILLPVYDFMEHESVGGIRIIRKGLVTEFPPQQPNYAGYDLIHSEAMRAKGYRVGYFKNLKMNHLGEGFSTVWGKPQ